MKNSEEREKVIGTEVRTIKVKSAYDVTLDGASPVASLV